MNNETFEQINISIDMIGDQYAFLQDGMNVIINIYNGVELIPALKTSRTFKNHTKHCYLGHVNCYVNCMLTVC